MLRGGVKSVRSPGARDPIVSSVDPMAARTAAKRGFRDAPGLACHHAQSEAAPPASQGSHLVRGYRLLS